MHWHTDYLNRPIKKTVKRFVLFPRICERDHWHWLEMVEINKRLIGGSYSSVDKYWEYNPDICPCNCNVPGE